MSTNDTAVQALDGKLAPAMPHGSRLLRVRQDVPERLLQRDLIIRWDKISVHRMLKECGDLTVRVTTTGTPEARYSATLVGMPASACGVCGRASTKTLACVRYAGNLAVPHVADEPHPVRDSQTVRTRAELGYAAASGGVATRLSRASGMSTVRPAKALRRLRTPSFIG